MLALSIALALVLAARATGSRPPSALVAATLDRRPSRSPALAAPPGREPVVVPRSDETMDFSVSYLGVPMGKVRLFVGKVDPSVAPIFLQAQTSSVLSFVTIRQQLASYLDVATGLPRSGSIDAIEGSYRHSDTVQYDRTRTRRPSASGGSTTTRTSVDVPPDTVDFVALVYRLRSLPLEPGRATSSACSPGAR